MLTDPSCQSLCVRCIMSENRSSTSAPDESSPETEESPSTGRWGRVIFWGLLLLVAAPSLLTLSGKHTLVLQWMGPEFSRGRPISHRPTALVVAGGVSHDHRTGSVGSRR